MDDDFCRWSMLRTCRNVIGPLQQRSFVRAQIGTPGMRVWLPNKVEGMTMVRS